MPDFSERATDQVLSEDPKLDMPHMNLPSLEFSVDPLEAEAALKQLSHVFFQDEQDGPGAFSLQPEHSSPLTDEAKYRALVEQISAVVFMASLDKGRGNAYVSPQIEATLGFRQDEWLADPIRWYRHIHPDDKARWSIEAAEMFLSGKPLKSIYRVIARNGRVVWFQCEAKMVRREDGRPWFIHGIAFDITELKETENALQEKHKQLQLLEDIATNSNQSRTAEEAMQFAIERICHYTGWSLGHAFLASEDQTQLLASNLWYSKENRFCAFHEASNRGNFSFEADIVGKVFTKGEPAWSRNVTSDSSFSRRSAARETGINSTSIFPVLNRGDVVAVLEFFAEISLEPEPAIMELMAHIGTQLGQVVDRVRTQEKLLHDAFHDRLTALPNRSLFLDRLERAIARSKRRGEYKFAVLFIDIDRFKIVNDSLGHAAGDELIIQASQRILHSLRLEDLVARPGSTPDPEWKIKDDTLARLGGDEFTVLLDDIRDPSDSIRVAERIQKAFLEPFVISGQDVFVSTSIGITANSPLVTAAEILRDADTAMYRAKLHGKARYEIFDQAMHDNSVSRLNLETDLRRALEREEFRVFYQPIVTLQTEKISGFEALLRWDKPGKGIVAPGEFIAVAEEMGLIVLIGLWVLRTACKQARQWHLENPTMQLTMSVNISARQFSQDDLVTQVAKILRETEVNPTSIKLEITETVTMGNAERTIKIVNELKNLGLQISIDDFGTGYSSLSYLRRFPMDTLKIDRSFVSKLESNPENREIIRTIVALAQSLGMNVVAEGAETPEEVNYLKTLNCEYAQGYLFSKPVDSIGARALLQESLDSGNR